MWRSMQPAACSAGRRRREGEGLGPVASRVRLQRREVRREAADVQMGGLPADVDIHRDEKLDM
jgi:hypothetical protein